VSTLHAIVVKCSLLNNQSERRFSAREDNVPQNTNQTSKIPKTNSLIKGKLMKSWSISYRICLFSWLVILVDQLNSKNTIFTAVFCSIFGGNFPQICLSTHGFSGCTKVQKVTQSLCLSATLSEKALLNIWQQSPTKWQLKVQLKVVDDGTPVKAREIGLWLAVSVARQASQSQLHIWKITRSKANLLNPEWRLNCFLKHLIPHVSRHFFLIVSSTSQDYRHSKEIIANFRATCQYEYKR
jgi:hypothetical protein